MKVMLSGRLGAGSAAEAPPTFAGGVDGRRPLRVLRPLGVGARFALTAAVLGLAGLVLLISRIGAIAGGAAAKAPAGPAVAFEGVDYQFLGVSVTKAIAQRGDRRITASGTFEIVKLRLHATDGLTHRVARDLVTLRAGGTYYGVSAPEDLGLTDRQWGLMRASTTVPGRGGGFNVKVVFDVPSGVTRHPISLHIGRFGYVGAAPARSLRLPDRPAGPAASAQTVAIGSLTPDPVLGGVVAQAEQTMPAATVALLASSIRMKLPVRRLLL